MIRAGWNSAALLLLAGSLYSLPAQSVELGFTFYSGFQGNSSSIGLVTRLDNSVGYNVNRFLGVDVAASLLSLISASPTQLPTRRSMFAPSSHVVLSATLKGVPTCGWRASSEWPDQASRMQDLLPAGTDVHQAADGFKNWGQFVSAAHVSKNLNIPFDHLKTKMTGPDSVSLGKAIAEMRPDLSKSEVKSSVKEAKRFEEQETKAEREQTKTSAQRREK